MNSIATTSIEFDFSVFKSLLLTNKLLAFQKLFDHLQRNLISLCDAEVHTTWFYADEHQKMKLVSFVGADVFTRLLSDEGMLISKVAQVFLMEGKYAAGKMVRDSLGLGLLEAHQWCKANKIYID